MTVEKRFSGTLDDISEVILTCKKCGATKGYDPKNWKLVPLSCGNCKEPVWTMIADSLEHLCFERLKDALRRAIEAKDSLPFEIRLEFKEGENAERN